MRILQSLIQGPSVVMLAMLTLLAGSGLPTGSVMAQVLIDPSIQSFSSQLSYCCNRKAIYIVNGSGLTAGPSGILGNSDSTHGNAPDGAMWVSDSGDASPWFVFDLGGTYNLQTTRIWNYNEAGGTAFGPSNILVSASADNVTFTPVTTITLNQAGGTSAEPAQDRSTAASAVRYVKLQILNNYGGGLFGLSEIRFVGAPLTPAITQQPHWQTLPAGSTASFTVSATGPGTLGYVWQKNGTPLPNGGNVAGATSTNLALSNISDTDAGGYSVVVTNVYGAVTSSVAQLLIGGVLVDPALLYYSSELTFCCDRIAIHMVDGSGVAAGASGVVGAYDSTVSSSPNGTMWLNVDNSTDPQPVLIFDLNGFFDLKIVRLWNYNEGGGNQANGVQTFEIAVSTNNVTYVVMGTNTMTMASGADGEPAQDFAVAAPGIRYVRLHLLSNYGAGRFGLSEVRFEATLLVPYGGVTLFTNATQVELANNSQKISFAMGADGKFHLTTSVWDGTNWRSFFDGGQPLIVGPAFNFQPTAYSILTNLDTQKVVQLTGYSTNPVNSFQIQVGVQSGSPLARFEISSQISSDVTLSTPQPTVGFWMNRSSVQLLMDQGPPSATRGAYAVPFNFGFPAAYLYDQNQEAAIFFDMTPMTWFATDGVWRYFNVQAQVFGNGTQTCLGLYPYGLWGNRLRAGEMLVPFYLYSAWRPQSPVRLSDMLDTMVQVFQPLHPGTSVFPTNTLDGGGVSWQTFAQRTIADLMVQNATYGDLTNQPYSDTPLPLLSLPSEMYVHPDFIVSNATDAVNKWSFATVNHHLAPSVLYTRLNNDTQVQHFVQLKKDALPRFYNPDYRLITSGTSQPSKVFGLELTWQTLVYYQEMLAVIGSLTKEDFNPGIGGRFLMGLDGLISYAHQVNYVFSVYYNPATKQPAPFSENPGLGTVREPWSVGSYCYVMLGGYEMTGDQQYLTEARTGDGHAHD